MVLEDVSGDICYHDKTIRLCFCYLLRGHAPFGVHVGSIWLVTFTFHSSTVLIPETTYFSIFFFVFYFKFSFFSNKIVVF